MSPTTILCYILRLAVLCCGESVEEKLDSALTRISELEGKLEAVTRRSYKTSSTAFYDRLSSETEVGAEPLLFDQVELNIGNVYDPFTAEETFVAFSTRLLEDTLVTDSPTVFEIVDLNIGDAYNKISGIFEPPVGGVYLLSIYTKNNLQSSGQIILKKNDDILCRVWNTATPTEQHGSSCTVVAELEAGDSVMVTGDSADPTGLRGDSFSGFSGHIIIQG